MVKVRLVLGIALPGILVALAGCVREPEGEFVDSPRVEKLKQGFQKEIRSALTESLRHAAGAQASGAAKSTAQRLGHGCEGLHPALPPVSRNDRRRQRAGRRLHAAETARLPCQGSSSSRRRSMVRSRFARISSERSSAVSSGTSMPSFRLLPQEDIDAVVDYVLALTMRGELESQLAEAAEFDEQVDPKTIPGLVDRLDAKWTAARGQVVFPRHAHAGVHGRARRAGEGSVSHQGMLQVPRRRRPRPDQGERGRRYLGQSDQGSRPDLGRRSAAGPRPLDIYRHIAAGINGTPMPSFQSALQKEPESMWMLTAYVLDLSNQRRKGVDPRGRPPEALARRRREGRGLAPVSADPPIARVESKKGTILCRPHRKPEELEALRSQLEAARGRARSRGARLGGEALSANTRCITRPGGFLLGLLGAMASLLFNVIGSLVAGKNPLELIRIYLTFPLGEKALRLVEAGQPRRVRRG